VVRRQRWTPVSRPAREQTLGGPALAAVTGLPERLGDVVCGWGRGGGEELLDAGHDPESGGVPELVDPGAFLDEQASDVPASVTAGPDVADASSSRAWAGLGERDCGVQSLFPS
jgi:hypothetical protein